MGRQSYDEIEQARRQVHDELVTVKCNPSSTPPGPTFGLMTRDAAEALVRDLALQGGYTRIEIA